MIQIKSYSIINKLTLTNELLVTYINSFWMDIFKDIKDNSHLLLMCKVQFSDEIMSHRTLGHLVKVNFADKELFIDYLSKRLSILSDSYITVPISKISFSYVIKSGETTDLERSLLNDVSDRPVGNHSFNNMILPSTMNPSEYGEIILDNYVQLEGEYFHRFVAVKGDKTYQIDVYNDGLINKVRILGNINLSWIDTKIGEIGTDIFKREIKKSTIYFMDGEKVLRKQELNAKPFKRLIYDANLFNNFYTLDIETINQNGKIIPYLICGYNGTDYITSYGNNQKSLFTTFFNQLLSKIKGGTTIVYAHNLSGFDGIFLLRHLLSFGKVTPVLFNGKLMSIKVKVLGDKKSEDKIIIFKDSYLLLPLALRTLCEAFNIGIGKGYFPFHLNDIFYSGVLPKLALWSGVSHKEYESLVSEFTGKVWSFKEEAIKYCHLDCKCLHELLCKFNELIFKEFQVNIHKVLTLPSLAMIIYKTHFMPKDSIYQIVNPKVESAIRESYTGGAVDVYIPHNRITSFFSKVGAMFKRLYYYDVNSLYPAMMAFMDMPIGKPIAFEGNIRLVEPKAFGFFYCKITSPDNLEHPILQRRIKTESGMRTIAGLGSWEGWIFSEEMDNAVQYGYTFEILNGYQFDKGNLFKEYVTKMYTLRTEYPKGHPMNLIAKLLMNSLYGKFGMKLNTTRVEMSYFKNNPNFKLYYSDTDSAVVDAPLPDFMVGDGLGQLKLEHTINKAIFLAPKVYGLVDIDGNEIIKVKGIGHTLAKDLHIEHLELLLLKIQKENLHKKNGSKK